MIENCALAWPFRLSLIIIIAFSRVVSTSNTLQNVNQSPQRQHHHQLSVVERRQIEWEESWFSSNRDFNFQAATTTARDQQCSSDDWRRRRRWRDDVKSWSRRIERNLFSAIVTYQLQTENEHRDNTWSSLSSYQHWLNTVHKGHTTRHAELQQPWRHWLGSKKIAFHVFCYFFNLLAVYFAAIPHALCQQWERAWGFNQERSKSMSIAFVFVNFSRHSRFSLLPPRTSQRDANRHDQLKSLTFFLLLSMSVASWFMTDNISRVWNAIMSNVNYLRKHKFSSRVALKTDRVSHTKKTSSC